MDYFVSLRVAFWFLYVVICAALIIVMAHRKRRKKAEKPKSNIKVGNPYVASGVVFGKDLDNPRKIWYSPYTDEGHVIVFGGTGTGKTADVLIPTLRAWFRGNGSSLVVDLAGDIAEACPSDKTIIFCPENPECPPFDVLWLIDQEQDYRERDLLLDEFARFVVQDPPLSAGDTRTYYANTAQEIFLAAFVTLYDEGYDFIPLCKLIYQNSFDQIVALVESDPNRSHYKLAHAILAPKVGANQANINGGMDALEKAIKPFATNPYLETVLRRGKAEDNVVLNAATCIHNNLFLKFQEKHGKTYGSTLSIITQEAFYFLKDKENKKEKILFGLDEFSAFGKIEISDTLARLRKRGVRIMVLTQSLADLDEIYGEKERVKMLDNFDSIAVLRATDASSQKYFSDLVGTYVRVNTTRTRGASFLSLRETTLSDSETREKHIQPEDFARLGDTLILLHRGGWTRLAKNHYWIGKQPASAPNLEPEPTPENDDYDCKCLAELFFYKEKNGR